MSVSVSVSDPLGLHGYTTDLNLGNLEVALTLGAPRHVHCSFGPVFVMLPRRSVSPVT